MGLRTSGTSNKTNNSSNKNTPSSGEPSAMLQMTDDELFETVTKPKKQAIGLLYGRGKSGKTSFVTRFAPEPILVLDFDRRSEKALSDAHKQGRKVNRTLIDYPTDYLEPEKAKECAIASMEKALLAVKRGAEKYRTILIDTATEASQVMRMAYDGDLTKEIPYKKSAYSYRIGT